MNNKPGIGLQSTRSNGSISTIYNYFASLIYNLQLIFAPKYTIYNKSQPTMLLAGYHYRKCPQPPSKSILLNPGIQKIPPREIPK